MSRHTAKRPLKKASWQGKVFLGEAGLAVFSLLIVSIFLVSSLDTLIIKSDQYAGVLAAVLIDLANGDRTTNNLQTLTTNAELVAAAQAKANDMAVKGYFAHISPDGRDSWHWFKEAGYSFTYAGENLAVDFSDSGDVEKAWMNSPTHRANILDGHFTEIGIATAVGSYHGHTAIFAVQMFGSPGGRVQGTVRSATSPRNPGEPAVATTQKDTVLGATIAKVDTKLEKAQAALSTEVASSYASSWAHLIASPRSTLRYTYYALALVIAALLVLATGWEIHRHHMRQARTAALLLALMLVLVLFAENYVFTSPVLADTALVRS